MPPQAYGPPGGMPPPGYMGGPPIPAGYPQAMMAAGPCTIRVKVMSASGLAAMDANGKADPYVVLRFDGQPRPYTKTEGKIDAKKSSAAKKGKIARPQTTVQKKTLSPTWNQTFDMVLPGPPQPTDILTLEIYDHDAVGQHDFMGSAHVEMAALNIGMERVGTYKVFTKKGTVTVGVTAMNFSCPPIQPGLEGNMQANMQMAAENARKRAQYKKAKKAYDMKKDVGKGLKKGIKSFGKMF